MSTNFPFVAAHTAILSMDCQTGIVSVYAKGEKDAFLARAASVLEHARDSGMMVIHVQVGFRPGLPEVSTRNPLLSAIKSSPERQQLFQGPMGAIPATIAPRDGEVVIAKHRVSAFTGTDLGMILRANEVDTLVLFGIATSGVVLSTLLDAFDNDFRLTVIRDCCIDGNADVHDCLVGKFFPTRATVVSAEEFVGDSPLGSQVHTGKV